MSKKNPNAAVAANIAYLIGASKVNLRGISFSPTGSARARAIVLRGKKSPKKMTLDLATSPEALAAALAAPTPAEARAARKTAAAKAKALRQKAAVAKAKAAAKARAAKSKSKSKPKSVKRTASKAIPLI